MIRYKEQGGSLNKLHPRRPLSRQQFPACSRLPCLPGIGSVFPKQRSSHRVQPGRARLGVCWQLHRREAQDWENYRYPCLTNNCRLQTARGVCGARTCCPTVSQRTRPTSLAPCWGSREDGERRVKRKQRHRQLFREKAEITASAPTAFPQTNASPRQAKQNQKSRPPVHFCSRKVSFSTCSLKSLT